MEYSKYVEHSNIKEYETDKKDSKYLSFIDYVNTEIVHYKREVICHAVQTHTFHLAVLMGGRPTYKLGRNTKGWIGSTNKEKNV